MFRFAWLHLSGPSQRGLRAPDVVTVLAAAEDLLGFFIRFAGSSSSYPETYICIFYLKDHTACVRPVLLLRSIVLYNQWIS